MNTLKNFIKTIFGCAAAVFLVYTYAFAGGDVGMVTYVEGKADVLRQNTTMAVPLREDELIFVKDAIRTKSNSKAEITFKDKSMLRLAQNSRVEITDYQLDEKNRRKEATVNLLRGKARTIIAKMHAGADFNILTPNTQGKIKGSDVFTFFQAGVSGMLVSSGTLSVANTAYPQDAVIVTPGNSVVVPEGETPKGPRPYLEMEKKFHEQDTNPPAETLRKRDLATIRGVVTKISGIVKITARGERIARDAKINEIVGAGDTIETGVKGKIEVKFDNGNALNIKPDSRLVIVKLTADPKTNDYDNYFELSLGKVKATIEKLPQNSSFRVKTPTAISGVRGTIMYIDVTLLATKVLFEGGMGFITSLVSGETQEVGMGETAFTDDSGMVSEPALVSDAERTDVTEDWEPGSGIEGYSTPEGSSGLYLYESGTDVQTVGGAGNTDNPTQDTLTGGTSTDIPFTESNPQTETTEPYSLSGNFSGNFAYYDSWSGPEQDYLHLTDNITNGALTGTGVLWTGSQPVTLSGNFTRDSLDYTEEDLWVVDSADLYGITTDGARFLGTAGGIKIDNSLKGIFYALYIRLVGSGYQIGYLSSTNLSGNIDAGLSGGFSLSGILGYHDMASTALSPQDFYRNTPYIRENNEQGKVGGSNSFLSGNIKVDIFALEAPHSGLGIWRVNGGGSYTTAPTAAWSADLGGHSVNQTPGITDAYWLGTISGDASWGSRDFSGNMSGTVLNDEWLEEFNGTGYGIHYPHELSPTGYSWEFLGAGENHETLNLSSSGRLVAQGWNIGEGSPFDFAGLIGLTGPIWGAEDQPDFISIGEFTPPDSSNPDKQFAWHVQKEWYYPDGGLAGEDGFVSRYISQSSPLTYNYSTYDDGSGVGNGVGSFYGLSAGVGGNGKLEGKIYSLYISPTDVNNVFDAGMLYGDVDGNYYDGIGMYRLGGELTKNLYTSNIGISPENLHTNISWDNLTGSPDGGSFAGDEDTGPDVLGFSGTMLNIGQQNWGVWNFVTNGTYQGPTSDTWDVYDLTGMTTSADTNYVGGSWLGGIGSLTPAGGKWSGDEIEGTLEAIWIGLRKDGTLSGRKVNGEVVGNYIEVDSGNGTWQAASAGEWVEVISVLDQNNLTSDIIAVGQSANVPITEVYSSLMTGAGGGITSMNMDTRLYNMGPGGGDGIWAAIINGAYSIPPTDVWTVVVTNPSNPADNATLSGPAWSDGHWIATNVAGMVNGNTVTGQAAGTYGDGIFSGAGTGTYEHE